MKREGDGRKVSKTSNKANSELRSGGGCGGVFFTGRFGVVLMYSAARHAHFKQTGCSYMRLIRALCSGGKELGGVRCGEYVLEGMRSTRGGRGNVIDRCSYGVMQMASLGTISSSVQVVQPERDSSDSASVSLSSASGNISFKIQQEQTSLSELLWKCVCEKT